MTRSAPYPKSIKAMIPAPRAEDWRYADLSLIRTRDLPAAARGDAVRSPGAITSWPRVVIGNGKVLEMTAALEGVEIAFAGAGKTPAWATKALGEDYGHPFARIARDYGEGGVLIRLTTGAKLSGLEVVLVEDGKNAGARHLTNLIVLDEGASANVLIRTLTKRPSSWLNVVTSVAVGKNARLFMAGDFEAAPETLVSNLTKARVGGGGALDVFSFGLGVPSLRNEIEVSLDGEAASVRLAGGLLAGDGETVDVMTRVTHAQPGARSDQTFRAVAGKRGTTAFQGRVVVAENAQKTEAHQTCHNLILERSGEANVKPELLIFADDVICSHGATVGEIDAASLFYLMQRGIPEPEARAILIQAFLGDVIETITEPDLSGHFAAKAGAWMAKTLKGAGQ